MKKILLILFTLILLNGCNVQPSEYTSAQEPINIQKGDKFIIKLDENRTTGYQWRISKPLNKDLVNLVGKKYIPPESKKLGTSGQIKLIFKTTGTGTTTIPLEYIRPWKKVKKPTEKKEFKIKIK